MSRKTTRKQKRITPDAAFTGSILVTQAIGIVETVIAVKPIASTLNDGEIAQALYAATDQLRRALAIFDGEGVPS